MSFLSKTVKKAYNELTNSSSKLGKVGRYAFPFNATYLTRDAWRKYGKNLFGSPSSASSLAGTGFYGGSSGVYGPTGSIVGKY